VAKLNLDTVEKRVSTLGGRESYTEEFLYDLLLAYGKPKSTITRLRKGDNNMSSEPDHVLLKNTVDFVVTSGDLIVAVTELKQHPEVERATPRFAIATDLEELAAIDLRTGDSLAIPLRKIDQHFAFFLPWAGMEKTQYISEAHADVKAAERMGKLFDELLKANPEVLDAEGGRHSLNVFFTRLLFCLFAEDTGIFEDSQFTNALGSLTQEDGSDMAAILEAIFLALDTALPEDKPRHLAHFPYVNGRLFTHRPDDCIPAFTSKARKMLIELGTLKWEAINPDIFGSMFQAIVSTKQRSDLGQHYTSVPNILKTIEPLFMDELRDEFSKASDSVKRLEKLLDRISAIKIFDPACGTGNFLVIAYKELRKLEHAILERLAEIDPKHQVLFTESRINIENFYGIEIEDVASEIAVLSLWIAKHQMNVEFKDKFGVDIPLIPLKETGHIHTGNACRVDWNEVCPNDGKQEIYLIGNPPYKGSKTMPKEMKEDYPYVFGDRAYSKNLDYVALWFIKGSDYIKRTKSQLAFITTNSLAQGEHVGLMFPMIFAMGLEIGYAYTSFKWSNNAKRNAGVTVAVISLRARSSKPKMIFSENLRHEVQHINGYLIDAKNVTITTRRANLNTSFPSMQFGNMPLCGDALLLSGNEVDLLVQQHPDTKKFIRRFFGSNEFIKGIDRYCLWITDEDASDALEHPGLAPRIEQVRQARLASKDAGTRRHAKTPWKFREQNQGTAIIVPGVSSENRDYIPIGFLGSDTVVSNSAFAIYDAEPWLFALLTSKMHMAWVRTVGGQLKTSWRYSNTLVYNTFPVPPLSERTKRRLTEAAFRVLDVREYHCESTLAELYDKDAMPQDLREAHQEVDQLVDSIYSRNGFESDEERLAALFDLYEKMIGEEEQAKGKKK